MSKPRILFTGGGTAGHVIVNLALIPYYHEQGWEIDYIGSIDGIERELVSEFDYVTYYPISTGKLRRYMSIENFKDPFKVLKGMFQSWNIMRKTKPNIVFSKGGFVSVPVSIAAWIRRVPTLVHESDFTPGLANKLATPFAKRILTTFPETVNYLPVKKTEYIGAIVRKELLEGSKEKGYELTGLNASLPILLVMGGSGGSENINRLIRTHLDTLLETHQVIHICGKGNKDAQLNKEGYVQYEYLTNELPHIFAISQQIISRAGANAIFEFLALNIPMLLIPLSRNASRGDQIVNAKSFEKQGYALVLEEEEIEADSDQFMVKFKELIEKSDQLIRNMEKNETRDSFKLLVDIIESLRKK